MIYTSPYVYSFGKKSKNTDRNFISKGSDLNPGPGAYESNQINKATAQKTFSFGKDDKLKGIKNTTPGPGDYNGGNLVAFGQNTPHFSMGKNNRKSPFENTKEEASHTLGPGYYQTEGNWDKTKPRSRCVKMGAPPKEKGEIKTPGPGEYESKEYFGKNGKSTKIGTSQAKRDSYFLNGVKENDGIGPGHYNANRSSFDQRNAKITIKGKPTDMKSLNTPGPGEYNYDQASLKMGKTMPKFSLGKEDRTGDNFLMNKNEMNNPGPGCYQTKSDFNVTSPNSIKAASFSKGEKLKAGKGSNIGPGYYKIPCTIAHVPDHCGGDFEPEFKFV